MTDHNNSEAASQPFNEGGEHRHEPTVADAANNHDATRRQFLKQAGITGAGLALGAAGGQAANAQTSGTGAAGSARAAESVHADPNAGDPGPSNPLLAAQNPDAYLPPASDHGEVPSFWHSFSLMHRRIQGGGWTRQVNVQDFPLSKEIAGVNMRLTAGGVRELHWHKADEWALMLTGNARLTAIDLEGRSYVNDVAAGDLWYFPAGIPHSIQGLGPDGCEFLLVFDEGDFSEGNTTLLTDWVKHTPREVVAKNWNVAAPSLTPLDRLPQEGKYIFQAAVPGPLDQDRQAAASAKPRSPVAFEFRMRAMPPTTATRMGEVRIIDSRNFPVAAHIAAAYVIIKPGGLREMHWHPNADEWQYYVQGKGRMTLFINGGKARTADFTASDVGYVPRTLGHYIENTGDTDLIYLEMFKADRFQDLSLNDWITHTPPELVRQHLEISPPTLAAIPKGKHDLLPE